MRTCGIKTFPKQIQYALQAWPSGVCILLSGDLYSTSFKCTSKRVYNQINTTPSQYHQYFSHRKHRGPF